MKHVLKQVQYRFAVIYETPSIDYLDIFNVAVVYHVTLVAIGHMGCRRNFALW